MPYLKRQPEPEKQPEHKDSDDDVLTIRESAAYLRVSEKTLADSLKGDDPPPGFRVGMGRGQWRFLRSELKAWARRRARCAQQQEGQP